MATSYLDKWQPVADDVLSVVLATPQKWIDVINAGVTSQDMPPGAYRPAFMAIMELAAARKENEVSHLHDTEVAIKAGQGVSVEWVAERLGLCDSSRMGMFAHQLATLKKFGKGAQQLATLKRGIDKTMLAMNNGLDVDSPAIEVLADLQAEQRQTRVSADIGDIADMVERRFEQDPMPTIKTGIDPIDRWLGGGVGKEEFIGWAGPEKQRKTSVMANALVNISRQQKQIDVFSFDESRDGMYLRLQAILMAEWMYNNGFYNLAHDRTGEPVNIMSRKILGRVGKNWRKWPEPLQEARLWAKAELEKFRGFIRIYDQELCPPILDGITARVRMDAQQHGGIDGVFVDHIQSLKGYKSEYDLLRDGSNIFHSIRGEFQCFMWVLSQQNKTGIAGGDEGAWSAEMAGGASLEQKADTIFVSKYKTGDAPDPKSLKIELKKARDEDGQRWENVTIHPPSGWILPAQTKGVR